MLRCCKGHDCLEFEGGFGNKSCDLDASRGAPYLRLRNAFGLHEYITDAIKRKQPWRATCSLPPAAVGGDLFCGLSVSVGN